jgi:hypothetical protein
MNLTYYYVRNSIVAKEGSGNHMNLDVVVEIL